MFPIEYETVPPECLLTIEMDYVCSCKCDKNALLQTDHMYLDIPLRRCNFCEIILKMLPVRPKYPAETINIYRPPEVAEASKMQKRKTNSFFLLHF